MNEAEYNEDNRGDYVQPVHVVFLSSLRKPGDDGQQQEQQHGKEQYTFHNFEF
jgi:hypothetical protein